MDKVILFADNEPDFLDTRAEFLEKEGYTVIKAYTLEQARRFLGEKHLHLAILDIRLVDDDDEKDISGITLAKDPAFRSIPKIILTNFPSYQTVRDVLGVAVDGMPSAVEYLFKGEGAEAMLEAVARAFS
ncbi:MAG: response regulator, partial [Caldilineae bacterium]